MFGGLFCRIDLHQMWNKGLTPKTNREDVKVFVFVFVEHVWCVQYLNVFVTEGKTRCQSSHSQGTHGSHFVIKEKIGMFIPNSRTPHPLHSLTECLGVSEEPNGDCVWKSSQVSKHSPRVRIGSDTIAFANILTFSRSRATCCQREKRHMRKTTLTSVEVLENVDKKALLPTVGSFPTTRTSLKQFRVCFIRIFLEVLREHPSQLVQHFLVRRLISPTIGREQ